MYLLLSKKPIHLGKDTDDNSPTIRIASDRVVPCLFVASQVYFPACSQVTAWMYREPEPARDVTGSGSELPGLNKWGFRDLDLRAWDRWLVINPCLLYQRMAGTGTPAALQDKVTESPTATSALAGALTIMGLSPLPIKEKIIHIQKLSTLYIVSTTQNNFILLHKCKYRAVKRACPQVSSAHLVTANIEHAKPKPQTLPWKRCKEV